MEWVETTGKSVTEAKEAALDELGVDETDAEFEVLEEPRQGLFGRQRGEARVRARVRPTSPRPKAERRSRPKKKSDGVAPETNVRSIEASDKDASIEVPPTSEARRTPKKLAPDVAAAVVVASEEASDAPARRGARRRPSPAGGRTNGDRGRPSSGQSEGAQVPEEELSMVDQGRIAEEFVIGLLQKFNAPAKTSHAVVDDDTVEIQVTGEELGLLIGPKGQTLQAVQELARTVVQRKSVARTGRIHVDIAGYRSKRREALARFTVQVAQDVVTTGLQRVLEPMSAPDRKVVHDTANDITGVRTVSEGEDPRRRVVIIPEPVSAEA
ncbi:MAG: hypothetical protein NVS3B12_15560 [Acidimicrobiales bacterium]